MITITKERLLKIQQWRETYGPGSNVVLPAEEAEELARIALASLEAEPVAYADPQAFRNFQAGDARREWMWRNPGEDLIPVYTTPPEPVAVPVYQVFSFKRWRDVSEEVLEAEKKDGCQVRVLYTTHREEV